MAADEIALVASALSNRTRAAFCEALLDGQAWSVSRLAREAGVSISTASEHITMLVSAGLCKEHRQGRARYVELADPRVAACLEDLGSLLAPRSRAAGNFRAAVRRDTLARGRTCYDHLAGRIGVALGDALHALGVLDADLAVTSDGLEWINDRLDPVPVGRRPRWRSCLDWTERRPHLAGATGAHICAVFFDRRWIRRIGAGRAVRLTTEGQDALSDLLGPAFVRASTEPPTGQ